MRISLTVGVLGVVLAGTLGIMLGLIAGYVGGAVDGLIMRIADVQLTFPAILIALLVNGVVKSVMGNRLDAMSTLAVLVFAIGLSFWVQYARTVRGSVMVEKSKDYVAAAQLRHESALHTMFVEILPNVIPPILVETTVRLGYAIFAVATLSFMGFGIQPPSPDWGLSISSNYGMIGGGFWWTVLFDALAIASLVIGVNLVADGVQGALND